MGANFQVYSEQEFALRFSQVMWPWWKRTNLRSCVILSASIFASLISWSATYQLAEAKIQLITYSHLLTFDLFFHTGATLNFWSFCIPCSIRLITSTNRCRSCAKSLFTSRQFIYHSCSHKCIQLQLLLFLELFNTRIDCKVLSSTYAWRNVWIL